MRFGFANYLLRFDDMCPTMNWLVWNHIEELLMHYGVQPVLAVVPDNQDPKLRVAPADTSFWERVRRWQARGWAIGLHGYQHRFVTQEPGMVPVNRYSEFAGLPIGEQETKLRRALQIFAREGIRADLWIAPAHSFDAHTLAVLRRLELRVISDGFFLWPHTDRFGIFWIPQQLWSFRRRPAGLWTVCHHHNGWGPAELSKLERDLETYRSAIVDFEAVRSRYARRPDTFFDGVFSRMYLGAAKMKGA